MNLKEFLEKKGRLTQRERKLIIDAWVEASGVFDEGATRAAEQQRAPVQTEQAGARLCKNCGGVIGIRSCSCDS